LFCKVAIDASSASSGGAVRYLSQICPALAQAAPGNSYFLLNRAAQQSQLPELPDNFRWVQIPDYTASLPRRLLWLQVGLPKILRNIGADVLFAASDVSTLQPPCPMVVMVHNFNPFSPSRNEVWSRSQLARITLHRWLIRRTAQKAARVIFVSEWSSQEITPHLGIPAHRTTVIYHGVDQDFSPSTGGSSSRKSPRFLLAVSEVLQHKNLHRMVEAYCNLTQMMDDDLQLVIAGSVGSQSVKSSLEQTLSKHGMLNRVTFTGFVSKDELANLYRQAELLIFPSMVETFGLPLIEAMASGLPVVTSNATVMPEICQEATLYFDPQSVPEMTQTMQRVLTNSNLRDDLIRQGLRRASNFSWKTTADSLLSTLEQAKSES